MIKCKLIFWTNDIDDITMFLPFAPRIGEKFEFPLFYIKYTNGIYLEEKTFNISNVDWVVMGGEFDHLDIYLSNPN